MESVKEILLEILEGALVLDVGIRADVHPPKPRDVLPKHLGGSADDLQEIVEPIPYSLEPRPAENAILDRIFGDVNNPRPIDERLELRSREDRLALPAR